MFLRIAACLLGLLATFPAWAQTPSVPTAIYVMKADGSDVRKLAEVAGFEDHEAPRWSHDGKRVSFNARSLANRQRSCFVVNFDGSGLREIAMGRFADWSPDDSQVAFQLDGSDGSSEILVQNLNGQGLTKIRPGRSPRWSLDGSVLINSDRTMLRALDLLSDDEIDLLPARVDKVYDGFAWSPDGESLAAVIRTDEGGPRQLFFLDPTAENRDLAPRLSNAMGGFVSYSPDGKQLVFADASRIAIVEVAGNAPPRVVPDQEGKNRHPAFSPDGKWIAFSGSRTTPLAAPAKKAAMPTAKLLKEVRRHDRRAIVWSLDFTPDGRSAVLGGANGSGVQIWDLTNGATRDLGGNGVLVQAFPDGRRFATSFIRNQAQIVDIDSGEIEKEFDHGDRIWAFCISPDGRRLLTGGLDKIIRIWDVDTGKQVVVFDPQADYFTRAIFSPDSKEVITGGHDKTLRVFDAETGKLRLAIEHPGAIWGLAASPDGRYILTGTGGSLTGSLSGLNIGESQDHTLRVWDRDTGKLVREIKGHDEIIFTIDVSPDSRLALTGSADSTMRMWDLSTGEEVSRIGPEKGLVSCVRFSPDGKLVIAGGGISRIGGQVIQFPREQIRVYEVLDAAEAAAADNRPNTDTESN